MKILKSLILLLFSTIAFSQNKMRTVDELINEKESAWPLVKEWIQSAKNKVEILSAENEKSKDALYKTQVTTRSPMGTIIYHTGGILIENGWIRILGSGNEKMNRNLPDWNLGKTHNSLEQKPPYLLIADDVIGGFFLLNGGGLGNDLGKIYYLAPDSLEFESLGMSYTEFLFFCFNNDLDDFYKGLRWKNWKSEVSKLNGDTVFNFYPYLWTKEGKNIEKNSKKEIPIEEGYSFIMGFIKK